MTSRIQIVLLLALVLLSGCGEVIVFGHVVREGNKSAGSAASSSAASAPAATDTKAVAPAAASTAAPATTAAATATTQTSTPTTGQAVPETVAGSSAPVATVKPTDPTVHQVQGITLTIAPTLAASLAKDSRFNKDTLLHDIKAELLTRGLLQPGDSQSGITLEIYIGHYDLHANTNFVIFGATPHTGTLVGNLLLKDAQDDALPSFRIEAHARISIPEGNEPRTLLEPLYHEFAVTVADSLAGTHRKPEVEDQTGR